MGGIGSGTYARLGTRNTVDDMRALPISKLSKAGWLSSGGTCAFTWSRAGRRIGAINETAAAGHVVLSYKARSNGTEWRDMKYSVQIDRTPCNLGGTRAWFICPAQGCGRRVATLYGGAVFACRHCHRLAYPSENESRHDRTARRADKLRDRLQWPQGILNGSGWGKPKHMHRVTYHRLEQEYRQLEAQALGGIMKWPHRFK
ncbi:hypothetical protein [Loktanella salsilacus]|uniref:hypothetical protein n=1 Tax=Loktanella salsilacus TaxID=195913 RepID=UPI0037365AA6